MSETARRAGRAAALTLFIAGTVLMLVNPPSFSGVRGLLMIMGAAVVVVVLTAWATVTLAGRRSMSERQFERVVERSERLARRPPPPAGGGDPFERLVAEAIDRLPEEFRRLLDHTPVVVSSLGAGEHAYGHYFGDTVARGNREDRIVLYRDTLERDFGHDPDLLAAQVERTLRHELAHHLGWAEPGVRGLGL